MKKTTVALFLAAFVAATANPALAGCGGAHGKAYRAAQSVKKPTVAKKTEPNIPAPVAATSALDQTTTIAAGTAVESSFTEL